MATLRLIAFIGPGSPQRIAQALLEVPTECGFVLALEGPRGSGKTSIVNLMRAYFSGLNGDAEPLVWSFNPWQIGSSETLVETFLIQFAQAVGFKDHATQGKVVAKQLLGYSSVFTALN